jgi:hypothetical protein
MRGQQRFLFATTLSLSLLLGQAPARAVVGAGSCVTGVDPCLRNTGSVDHDACKGDQACFGNSGAIASQQRLQRGARLLRQYSRPGAG